jgi:hypothetical protein
MHGRSQSLDGCLANESIRIFGQDPNPNGDHVLLGGTAFTFLALITRKRMQRSRSNARLLMLEVVHQFGNGIRIEEVVENIATPSANPWVGMLQSAPDGVRRHRSRRHERPHRDLGAMVDREILDKFFVRDRHCHDGDPSRRPIGAHAVARS